MTEKSEVVICTAGTGSEADLRHVQPFYQGEILIRLQNPGTFTVEVGGEPILTIARSEGAVRVDLGPAGGERLVLGDRFRAFLNEFISAKFDAHVHAVSGNVTTPPQAAFIGAQMPEELLSSVTRTR